MGTNSFKSTYRFGGTIFVISVLTMSIIFGTLFRSCGVSDNVVNVNLPESVDGKSDTVVIEKEVERVIRDTVRIPYTSKIKQSNDNGSFLKKDTIK
jgi:hypothetical protein